MPTGPAARLNDLTAHGGTLIPGLPSLNVIIGGQPAWLGMTAAAVAALAATIAAGAKDVADKTADVAAAGLAGPIAVAKAEKDLVEATAKAASDTAKAMTSSGASINACPSCGYSLAGLAKGSTCPECGREGAHGGYQ